MYCFTLQHHCKSSFRESPCQLHVRLSQWLVPSDHQYVSSNGLPYHERPMRGMSITPRLYALLSYLLDYRKADRPARRVRVSQQNAAHNVKIVISPCFHSPFFCIRLEHRPHDDLVCAFHCTLPARCICSATRRSNPFDTQSSSSAHI